MLSQTAKKSYQFVKAIKIATVKQYIMPLALHAIRRFNFNALCGWL